MVRQRAVSRAGGWTGGLRGWWWRCSAALEATRARDEGTRSTRWGWLGGHHRGRRSGRKGEGMGRREEAEGWQRGNGRAEEATRRRRYDDEALVEFVSTRYHSSGSICPHPSFCVSSSLSFFSSHPLSPLFFSRSLRCIRYLDSLARTLLSPSLHPAAASSFVPRFVPDTRRAGPLHSPLSLTPRALLRPARLVLSRQPHRFTFRVPLAVSLRLTIPCSLLLCRSIYLSPPHTRASRINPSPSRALRISGSLTGFLSLSLSLDFPLVLSQALLRVVLSRFSRSFFRRGTASRSSLRWIAMRETDRARGGETGDGG